MKYLWLIFLVCVAGLALEIGFSRAPVNSYADGKLVSLPVPPGRDRVPPPLLPAPVIQKIPPLAQPVPVAATSIEIFDDHADLGLAETRQADSVDWGLPRMLKGDAAAALAYAIEPRLVSPVPVNVPAPVARPLVLEELISTGTAAWSAHLERLSTETALLAWIYNASPAHSRLRNGKGAAAAVEGASDAAAPEDRTFYLPAEKVEVASLGPPTRSRPQHSGPNLYLPEGALDEEGAMLTLVKPEMRVYELPDESSAWTGEYLHSGDKVRPLTRLRNAEGFDWIKFNRDGKTYWAQAEYFIRVDPRNRRQFPEGNLAVGQEAVDKDSALPVDYKPNDLVEVKSHHVFGAKQVLLRQEAAEAFERMAEAAAKKGLVIKAFSGFRDFEYQKRLYLEAVEKNGPKQDGTAAPGYSEHQLGTTTDICGENRRTILSGKFGDTPEGRWLDENSEKFGFRKSYTTENSEEVGYKPEPWHFRYIGIAQNSGSKDIAKD